MAESGYPYSVYMIDSEWANHYGALRFDPEKFDDPQAMLKNVKALGFKVMVWESPFITSDSPEFRELKEKNLLVKSADGKIAVREWWDGISALLDITNPEAVQWLEERNEKLLALGVDGFKLDAGDVEYYRDDDITFGGVPARGQCKAWAEFGLRYPFNELRAGYNVGGKGINQRQADKWHRWEKPGLQAIVPEIIGMGLMGYWYTCPDMVGGGSIGQIGDIDEELFLRYAAASALMPMMQFSALPWRCLSKESNEICKKFAKMHESFGEYICALAENASKTGEPIARHLAYEFPCEGFETEMRAFMLGGEYLVAPVLEKGVRQKTLRLPKGQWQYFDGRIFEGGKEVTVDAPLDTLPYFKKI
ncbi:MAG: glycoside hydrolase [Clostridia bacterium]|nr:glycoside hydrolase [Clostridia bacterium]